MIPLPLQAGLVITTAALTFMASMLTDRPKPPTFLRVPHVVSDRDEIRVDVQSAPHPDRRAVLLEGYEGEYGEFEQCAPTPGPLIRSSQEPITEGNREQRTFRFHWRPPLRPGCYVLIARLACGGNSWGLTFSSQWSVLEVR